MLSEDHANLSKSGVLTSSDLKDADKELREKRIATFETWAACQKTRIECQKSAGE